MSTEEKSANIHSHECWAYRSPKPLRDILCEECAVGSEPRKPKKDQNLKTLSKGLYTKSRIVRHKAKKS